jgi:hypothetical protein
MIDKEKLIYLGVGILSFLVIINSTKKVVLTEVVEQPTTKSFDSSSLPVYLRPPNRLLVGEPLPKTLAKKRFSFNATRFDTNDF